MSQGRYRIQVTATKGEQMVVERQYEASINNWVTVGKYLTSNVQRLPKQHQPWMEVVPALFACSTLPRCIICGWPLADRVEDGCVAGNCSYRPASGTAEEMRIRQRHAQLLADAQGEVILCDKPCASAEADIVCGEPRASHTPEAAKGDVSMDHDFVDPETILPSIY